MAKETGKSGLVAKLGKKGIDAFERNKHNEVEFSGFGELPPGIENGIARLIDIKFDTFKKGDMVGEYYFMAQGTVLLPKSHDGIPIQGLRTRIGPEPICETPGRTRVTIEDHLKWVINIMKQFEIATEDMTLGDLETACAALVQSQPYFRFRTWQGEPTKEFPKPRVNHVWDGVINDYSPEDGEAAVKDNSEVGEPAARPQRKAPAANGRQQAPPTKPGQAKAGKSRLPQEDDINALLESAISGDADAQDRLTALAVAAGHDEDTVRDAASWQEVVDMISGVATADSTVPNGDSEVAWLPQVGEVYDYHPADPKSGRKSTKAVEVEVLSVNEDAKTVDLRNNTNRKQVYASVPFGDLQGAE